MHQIIYSPIATEKSMLLMEKENKITFAVYKNATKKAIKEEVERRLNVKVVDINILIVRSGKRAIVKLDKEYSADEIAGRIGIF
ncbi:MAG: 50S ribosomal protein L23 [Thermoplasmataceae archaeon]|jgi:large subunit ribosomal protein L23